MTRVALFAIWCFSLLTNVSLAISPEHLQKIEGAVPSKASAAPKQPRKLLVFNLCKGYKHSSIPYWDKALKIMGRKTGAYAAVFSNDMSRFKPENLKQFDAVCFNNTTKLDFSDRQLRRSLMDFIKGGKGIVGIHAATDNFYDWQEAAEMMGGQFCGHPWGAGGTWAVKIDDPEHPLTAAFGGKGFKIKDEIYRTKAPLYSRSKQRVLLSLNMTDEATRAKGAEPGDLDTGISWVKSYGKGRIFYCSLGHNRHITWNPAVLQHYLDGIQFALGDFPADTTPGVRTQLDELLAEIATYEYGQSREPLTELTDFVRSAYDSGFPQSGVPPEALKRIERRFLQFLRSDATPAGKQFICRKLSIIGTEKAVPILAAMLTEKATSQIQPADMSRYALERIPGPAVDKALRDALDQTSGKVKVGIINSLGERGDKKVVRQLSRLLSDTDKEIAEAAISALGKIGGKEATKALSRARAKVGTQLHFAWADAYLMCADKFLAEGDTRSATRIYEQLYVPGESATIRIAALRGMVTARPKRAGRIVVDVLKGDDEQMQAAAIGLLREIPGTEMIKAVTAELPNLSVTGQVQVLSALADRGDRAALSAVVDATESAEVDVRIAAFSALAVLGDASSVDLLAEAAATTKGAEREAACEGLYRLRGSGVDEKILASIPRADSKVKVELIRSIGERNIVTGVEMLLKTAQDPQAEVRLESLKVLKVIADEKHLPALLELLIYARSEAERSGAENTVAGVTRKIGDKNRRAEKILAILPSVKQVKARCSLLRVLGKIGGSGALGVLRKALGDGNTEVQIAAIRALSGWPSPEPIDDLRKVVQSCDDQRHRILALRGFVRLLGLDSDRPPDETVKMYSQAMELAPNVSEKKMVLSGLAKIKSFAALQMAADYLEDRALQREAEAAVVKIAKATHGSRPQQTKAVVGKVIQISKNDLLRQEVQKLIEQIERFEDYITDWQVSGPYTKENTGASDLFGVVFGPEKSAAEDVRWQIMPAGTDRDRPWLMELDKAIGGSDRVAYLRTRVWSPKSQKVRLAVGSNDGIKVWLNGGVVHSNNVMRTIAPEDDKVEVTLREGWNRLMMKITQSGGTWSACARFRGLDGGRLPGLMVVADDAPEVGPKIQLTGDDFSAWGQDTGTWQIVGEAIVNPENEKLIATKPGSGVIVNGPKGKTVDLFSRAEFGDVKAHVEFMVPRGSNSGVYFMGRYEVQVLDSWGVRQPKFSDCGGIYQRWDENRSPKGYEGHPPRVNASLPPGQWQTYDVIFRAPRFDESGEKIANARFEKVIHNGIVVHDNVKVTGPTRAGAYRDEKPTGPLMLQGDHGPVAYRNIWILPLQ